MTDSYSHAEHLASIGELLAIWPRLSYEDHPTECYRAGPDYWIWQRGVGGIRFSAEEPEIIAFPCIRGDRSWFEYVVTRSWLPAAYHIWRRQVLHASAVRHASGDVVAFVGPSGAGKSTLAYGLGRRARWAPVCDDTLAFSCGGNGILLHPLPNEARLRPPSATYYGRNAALEPIAWPSGPLTLQGLYFLSEEEELVEPFRIVPLKVADAYVLALKQAHATTLKLPEHNRRLMRDYLDLVTRVATFRLCFRKSFAVIEELFDAIERHVVQREVEAAG